jgi:hypothetical protein
MLRVSFPCFAQPYYEHVETGEIVWEIPDRGWVQDRGALMQRAQERKTGQLESEVVEI